MLNIFMLFYCIALKGKANETEAKPNHDQVGWDGRDGYVRSDTSWREERESTCRGACHCRCHAGYVDSLALLKPKSYYVLHLTPK